MMPELKAGEVMPCLEQASELVNSALSSSYSIRSFTFKWQSIRDRLAELHSSLVAAAGNGDSRGASPVTKLLQAISSTARDTEHLALHCSDDSYNGGKLLMKSNLDVIAVKLESHVKQLNDVYASGILMNSQAIVLSKPGKGASREDMIFYVKDLFSRLRIGGMEMRALALAALSEVLQENEKYVKIVADENIDGVSILVNLLGFRDMTLQEEALHAVSVIAGFKSYRGMLVTAGVIPPLIRVFDWGSELAKERAAQALKQMTENCNNAWLVSSQGGVIALLRICSDDSSNCKLKSLACGVLRNISGVCEIKRFMVEEGIVSVLLKLLASKEEVFKIQAIEILYKLASEDEIIKQRAVREEVIESLLSVMNPDTLYSSKAREITLRAIEEFFFASTAAVKYLLKCGFLHRILFFLRDGEIVDQESALKAVSRFCRVSEDVKKAMGEMGFIPELMKLLEARSFEVRETAAEALFSMIFVQKNRRRFIQEEKSIDRLLQLLDAEEGKIATKQLLLSALMLITDSNCGRRKVAASSFVKNLEKLADTDMPDAKKIMKKLSRNRFRTILHGLWGS